jgi:hypothetical protein
VREEKIECLWRYVPGYLYAANSDEGKNEPRRLKEESVLAREMGFDVAFLDACPATHRPALAFANLLNFIPPSMSVPWQKRLLTWGLESMKTRRWLNSAKTVIMWSATAAR